MLRFSVSSGCVWLLWPSTASAGSAKLCMAFLTETGTLRCLTCCSAPWEMCWQRSFTGARGRKIIWPTLSSPCKGKHTALYDSLNNTEKTFTTLCDCDRVHTHTHTHTHLHSSMFICLSPAGNLAQQARGWAALQRYVISDTTRWLLVSTAAASLWRLPTLAGARQFCAVMGKLCNSPPHTPSKRRQSIRGSDNTTQSSQR